MFFYGYSNLRVMTFITHFMKGPHLKMKAVVTQPKPAKRLYSVQPLQQLNSIRQYGFNETKKN